MTFSNPTQIQIGMSATFAGRQYRVLGRVVLGIIEAGRSYYWNEYNLVSDQNEAATLVYEETVSGPEWRFFAMFDPKFPMTADEAGTKRFGDLINLDGDNYHITRVDHSRIYYVEGTAPEGEVVGARANYFNARAVNRLIVVSWTGSEIEFYRGMNLTSGMVASAFHLQNLARLKFHVSHVRNQVQANRILGVLAIVALPLVLLAIVADSRPVNRTPPVFNYAAPSPAFELSGEGTLDGATYRIESRAIVEVSEMGRRSQEHEYYLTNEAGGNALLIEGMQPGTKNWVLLTPLTPIDPMTAPQAARIPVGRVVNVDGFEAAVNELYRCKVVSWDGEEQLGLFNNATNYGFVGRQNTRSLLARWNLAGIAFYKGNPVTARDIASFGKTGGK